MHSLDDGPGGDLAREAAAPAGSLPGPRATFAALRHRNYRLWFWGQMVSLLGSWMQAMAQGFLVFELTRSPAWLGYVGFAGGAPFWFFALYGGVVADRLPRRSVLVATQIAQMALALVLAALAFSGIVRPWHIIVLAVGSGVANAFDAPARQAFVSELVPREDLTNAIALSAMMFNVGTTIGPGAAGLIYAALGPAWCFLVNAASFVAVLVALVAIRLRREPRPQRHGSALADLERGLRFTIGHRAIRTLIAGVGIGSVFGFALMNLMPAWATTVLGGDARTNGWLLSARGMGSLLGALTLATVAGSCRKGRMLTIGSFVVPLALLGFAQVHVLGLSLLLLAMAGWGFMAFFNSTNALVQSMVPDDLRARVMGIYTLVFFGLLPLGALLSGYLADRIGAPLTVTASAAALLAHAIVVRRRVPELSASW